MRAACLLFVTIVCLGSAGGRAEPLSCLIQPYQEADIGTQVVGVIDHVLVERGDFVKKGQPVVQLNSDVERAALAAAKLRAEATADLRAAASNHEFAQKKKVRTDDLYQKNFVSQQATDQAATEAQVAEMKLKQVREQLRLAQQELQLAQAQLAQRTIRSPLNGVVVEKYLSEGERVEEKAVVKVATIDPLKVEVIVPASYFSKIKQGMGANVKPEMAEATQQPAKVVVVDKVIDAASNSFRVRLELPNPNYQLPPGLRCKVDFDLGAPTAENAQPKPTTRPSADGVQPKPAIAPSADSAPQKSVARASVATAATK
jgi:membrane fusion protein, heavy metal efflux system